MTFVETELGLDCMVVPRIGPQLGSLSNISQRCDPFLVTGRRLYDSSDFGAMRRFGCASRHGNGVLHVGSGGSGSPVGDSEIRHDRGGTAAVEGMAAEAWLPGGGVREHGSVLGAGVQCSGPGMGGTEKAGTDRAATNVERGTTAAETGVGTDKDWSDVGESAGSKESAWPQDRQKRCLVAGALVPAMG